MLLPIMQQRNRSGQRSACRGVEREVGNGRAPKQTRQPKLPRLSAQPSNHFFRCANLLRNFSTRPPSESTLF